MTAVIAITEKKRSIKEREYNRATSYRNHVRSDGYIWRYWKRKMTMQISVSFLDKLNATEFGWNLLSGKNHVDSNFLHPLFHITPDTDIPFTAIPVKCQWPKIRNPLKF